nr:uncharacterized protein LOC117688069 isoform X2 [Crassostrea gigas]
MMSNKEDEQQKDKQPSSVDAMQGNTDADNTKGKHVEVQGATYNDNTNAGSSVDAMQGNTDADNTKGKHVEVQGATYNDNTNAGSSVDAMQGNTDADNTKGKHVEVQRSTYNDNTNAGSSVDAMQGNTDADNTKGKHVEVQRATYNDNTNAGSSVDAIPRKTDADKTKGKPAGGLVGCNPIRKTEMPMTDHPTWAIFKIFLMLISMILLFMLLAYSFLQRISPWKRKGFLICYQDNEDRILKKFWTQFLPRDPFPRELDSKEPSDVRLLMVFILPSVNRQNNVEALCNYISKVKEKYHLDDKREFTLVQISFDGNNSINPQNLVKGSTFATLKAEFEFNLVSCIDIIYRDEYDFENCEINEKAARNLISLSKRK